MRQSQLFGKTLRENPKDEVSANAKLLERGGFIYKTMAGVYDYLPLGYRVLEKIKGIIREEMNAIRGQEVFMTALQPKERWDKTARWKELGEEIMYQFKDHSGREIGLAATHEEALTEMALRSINSYKDLPLFIYQIQTKFRDELRAKSGLIRGRELVMKDLYSFHEDEKDFRRFYFGSADKAYKKVFQRCSLNVYVTEASGGSFTKERTHEYQVFSEAGEDLIFYCSQCRFAQNKEISSLRVGEKCPKCKGEIQSSRSIEIGNIFPLGTRYSKPLGLFYRDQKGNKELVTMGSYGIGISRLMGTIVEIHHDENGIIWPEEIAPFRVHLLELKSPESEVKNFAQKLYKALLAKDLEVLYDDRNDKTAGEKFADSDLIGIPWRVVVSEKTLEKKMAEVKRRDSTKSELFSPAKLFRKLSVSP